MLARFFLVLFLGFSASGSFADTAIDPAYDRFKLAITGNTARVTFGSDGTALARPAGSTAMSVGSNGAAFYNRAGTIPTKYGALPVALSQRFSVGALAKGVGLVLGGPLGVALVAGPYVYDWLADSGLSADSSGAFTQQVTVNTYQAFDGRVSQWYTGDIVTICNQVNTSYSTGFNDPTYTVAPSESPVSCNMTRGGQNISVSVAFVSSALTTQPITPGQLEAALASHPRTASEIEKILSETIRYPEIQPDAADQPVVTPTAPTAPKVSQKTSVATDGTQKTESTSCFVVGGIGGVTHEVSLVENCTTTTTDTKPVTLPDGTTTTQTVTTTGTSTTTDPAATQDEAAGDEFAMPCGVPGTPPCAVKVDETGVPSTVTMSDPFPQIQASQKEKLDQIKAADGSAWEPIKDLFFLPAATQCVPFAMPVVMGRQVPPIDPCPVVGGIQQVVGVLWYIAGFWIMLGWVREVV